MDKILEFLKGKKTYLLVLLYVALTLALGVDPDQGVIAGMDPEAIQSALMGLMVATAKAAWDRFANR